MGLKSQFCKCVNIPQIKALLWKDVLIKVRQPVSNCFYNTVLRVFSVNTITISTLNLYFYYYYYYSGWRHSNFYGLARYSLPYTHYGGNMVLMMLTIVNFLHVYYRDQPVYCHSFNRIFVQSITNARIPANITKFPNLKKHRTYHVELDTAIIDL